MHRTIEGLTDKELAALSEEDIDTIVRHQLMEKGIALPFPPAAPTYVEVAAPSHGYYYCEGLFPTIYFDSGEAFKKVIELLKTLGVKGRKKEFGDPSPIVIDTIRPDMNIYRSKYALIQEDAYTLEEVKTYSAAIKENHRLKKAFEQEEELYKEALSSASRVRNQIMEPILEAHARIREAEIAVTKFQEYMDLSEGNFETAWHFYRLANRPEQHVEDHLRAVHNQPVTEECGGDNA